MNIAELVATITIKGGKASIQTMKSLLNVTTGTKIGLMAAVAAFAKFSAEARKAAMELDMYQLATGLSGEKLQKLSYRAAQAGVSLSELAGTLQSIQQMTTEIALGDGNIAPFQRWGIGVSNDPTKVLDQVTKKLQALQKSDPARAAQIARDFGISNEMYYSLLIGETEEMEKQFVLTEKEQKDLVKLNKEWNKVWFYIKQITLKLRGMGAVFQTEIVQDILQFVKHVGEMLQYFTDLTKTSETFRKVLAGISLVIAGILAYMFPWTAAFVAIAVAVEDIFAFFKGDGETVTGQIVSWVQSSEKLMAVWEGIKSVFGIFVDLLKIAWKLIMKSFEGWKMIAQLLWDKLGKGIFQNVIIPALNWIKGLILEILGFIDMAIKSVIVLTQTKLGQKLLAKLGIKDEANDLARRYDDLFGRFGQTGPTGMFSQGNTVNFNQNNKIEMKSSGDPVQDGQAINEATKKNVSDALYQNPAFARRPMRASV